MSDGVLFTSLPTWDQMDFRQNCSLYGNWLASYIMPNPWDTSERVGASFLLSLDYFIASTPVSWDLPTAAERQQKVLQDISSWFTYHMYNFYNSTDGYWYISEEFKLRAIEEPVESCPAEFCKALGYTGNADTVGIGVCYRPLAPSDLLLTSSCKVYISYYIEASLATMYLLAYTVWQIQKWRKVHAKDGANAPLLPGSSPEMTRGSSKVKKPKHLPLSRRINDSFRGSLDAFLAASMLMSVVMLIAGIYASCIGRDTHDSNPNQPLPYLSSAIYDMVLSLLASVFSVFPVLLLYALMGRHGGRGISRDKTQPEDKKKTSSPPDIHRVWLRRGVLFVIWCLGAAEVYLAPRGDIDYNQRHDEDATMKTDFCDHRGGASYWYGMKAAQFLVIGAPLTWLVLTTFVITGFWIPGLANRPWVTRWRSVWRLTIAWLNMLIMWGLLAYFTVLRHEIIKTADGIDNDDTLNFGQILALATWVPVLAEFFYIFICEFLAAGVVVVS